jgi:hypothetical protein
MLLGVGILVAAPALGGCDWASFRNGGLRDGVNGLDSGPGAIFSGNVSFLQNTQHVINGVTSGGAAKPHTSPVTANGRLYLVGSDARLHVLDGNGNEVAGSPVTLFNETAPGNFAAPTVDNNTVLVDGAYTLYAFNATTLALMWSGRTDGYYAVGPYDSPVVTNGKVLVGANNSNGFVDVFDEASGTKLDSFMASDYLSAPIAYANGWIFYGDQSGGVYGRDITRQQTGWVWHGSGSILGIAVAGGDLVVSVNNGSLQELTTRGAHVGAFKNIDGTTVTPTSAPAIANGVVYVGAASGSLKSFGLASLQQVAASPNVNNVGQVTIVNDIVFTTGVGNGAGLRAFNANTLALLFSSGGLIASGSEPVVANGHVYDMLSIGALEIWHV